MSHDFTVTLLRVFFVLLLFFIQVLNPSHYTTQQFHTIQLCGCDNLCFEMSKEYLFPLHQLFYKSQLVASSKMTSEHAFQD